MALQQILNHRIIFLTGVVLVLEIPQSSVIIKIPVFSKE
jgi:hypothetical protein